MYAMNAMSLNDSQHGKIDVLFSKFEGNFKILQKKDIITIVTQVKDKTELKDKFITDLYTVRKAAFSKNLKMNLSEAEYIVCGVNSNNIKQQLLRVQNLTLDKALAICRV